MDKLEKVNSVIISSPLKSRKAIYLIDYESRLIFFFLIPSPLRLEEHKFWGEKNIYSLGHSKSHLNVSVVNT